MTTTDTDLFVKMVLDRWYGSLKDLDSVLNSVSDERLQSEVAPGKNRGVYLLGHLIAVHDDMLVILDMGPRLHPSLNEIFIKSPDKAVSHLPSVVDLRNYWTRQCEVVRQKFDQVKPEEWFEKHTVVSAEDFAREPHRNKLNVVITRTVHLQYHTGQLVLLK